MANALARKGFEVSAICFDENAGLPGYPLDSSVQFINAHNDSSDSFLDRGLVAKMRTWSLSKVQRKINRFVLKSCKYQEGIQSVLERLKKVDIFISYQCETTFVLRQLLNVKTPVVTMLHSNPSYYWDNPLFPFLKKAVEKSSVVQVLLPQFVEEARQYVKDVPIIVAGGVWNLEEYEDWIDNPELGPIAFQFGTRPMLTKETPISDYWKKALLNLKEGDVKTNHFSPTGFYSSAINNEFLQSLYDRLTREIPYKIVADETFNTEIVCGKTNKHYFIEEKEKANVEKWLKAGYTEALRTPDETIVFVTQETEREIHTDMKNCIGCLKNSSITSSSKYVLSAIIISFTFTL